MKTPEMQLQEMKTQAEALVARLRGHAEGNSPFAPHALITARAGFVRLIPTYSIILTLEKFKAAPPAAGLKQALMVTPSLAEPGFFNAFIGWIDERGVFAPQKQTKVNEEKKLALGLVDIYKKLT